MILIRGLSFLCMAGCLVVVMPGCGKGKTTTSSSSPTTTTGAADSGAPKDLIVGKWTGTEKGKDGKETTADFEFSADGKMKISPKGGPTMEMKYKFLDANTFEASTTVAGKTVSNKVKIESISKDKMVTSDDDGKTEYVRK